MPDSNQSQSAPDSHSQSLLSARDAGLGLLGRLKRIYHTKKSPTRTAVTAGVVTAAAVLFPVPFTIIGVITVVDDSLNAADARQELIDAVAAQLTKPQDTPADAAPVGAPAPAAG